MRYWLQAGLSAFSAFALFAVVGSVLARLAVRLLPRAAGRAAPAARARRLFQLRTLPAAAAFTAAFAIALPIFLWFEEPGTDEPISVTLACLAAGGLFLLTRGAWRAIAAWRSTARIVRDWQRRGRALEGVAESMPAFAIDESFPVVAVAGIVRPRLFIAECVLRECTPAQVAAMVSHECAHVSARDNIKRLTIRACPDVFGTPRRLEMAWSAAAEEAADARAADGSIATRLDLAQALIRVARLAAPRVPHLASAFYLGGSIDTRVRRLVESPDAGVAPAAWARPALVAAAGLLVAAVVLGAPSLHALMEQAVRLLP